MFVIDAITYRAILHRFFPIFKSSPLHRTQYVQILLLSDPRKMYEPHQVSSARSAD